MDTQVVERQESKVQYADGKWVKLGGRREYLLPALNFKQLKQYQDKLGSMQLNGSMPNPSQIDDMLDIVHAALSRNYPELKRDELEEMVDMANFADVFFALVNVSGLEARKPGEALATS